MEPLTLPQTSTPVLSLASCLLVTHCQEPATLAQARCVVRERLWLTQQTRSTAYSNNVLFVLCILNHNEKPSSCLLAPITVLCPKWLFLSVSVIFLVHPRAHHGSCWVIIKKEWLKYSEPGTDERDVKKMSSRVRLTLKLPYIYYLTL